MLFIFLLVLSAASLIYYILSSRGKTSNTSHVNRERNLDTIKPVDSSFKWYETEPLPLRPFVGKKSFRPSMGIQNVADKRESLFLIENTYLDCTNLRRQIASQYADKIIHCHNDERAIGAAREFYEMTVNFLCERYPHYFKLDEEKGVVSNLINHDFLPLKASLQNPRDLLKLLAGNIEEDFLILLKDDPNDHSQEYILRASLTGSPAGFDPSHNFDKPVSFIHGPVPQYQDRLESPMARFFNRLEPKDLWQRANWSVQTNNVLFKLEGHHARDGEEVEELTEDDIDFETACFLRCERQLFTRLPKSRAIVMLVRTYLTPIKQVRAEGLGPEMAHAIEQLPDDLAFYKRRQAWGTAVKHYLRTPLDS